MAAYWSLVASKLNESFLWRHEAIARLGIATHAICIAHTIGNFRQISVEHAALAQSRLQCHSLLNVDLAEIIAEYGETLCLLMVL